LAAVVTVGGFANLLRIAFAPTLWMIFAGGLVMLAYHRWRLGFAWPAAWNEKSGRIELFLSVMVIAGVIIFTVATQARPTEFNDHDDFEKYFAHPVRMLATGTLSGSPLSALGSESFGGQAFLHGFVLSAFPISYINGVDAVFGLLLLLALAASAGWRRLALLPGAVIGPLAIVAINPRYVNVSALYIGAALIATAVMLTADSREAALPPPLTLGLVLAAIIAVKPTLALFVALYLPLLALAVMVWKRSVRGGAAWTGRVVLWAALGLLPWLALHLPNYLQARSHAGDPAPLPLVFEDINLLSTEPLHYGSCLATYTALVAVAAMAGTLAAFSLRDISDKSQRLAAYGVLVATTTGVLSYLLLVLALPEMFSGLGINLRFSVPILLGSTVIPVLLVAALPSRLPRALHVGFPALALVAASAAFVPSLVARCRQAVQAGSILAFSDEAQKPSYLSYNKAALDNSMKEFIRQLQAKVPPGQPLLAWINTPFHLDYRRNPIHDAEPAGLATPWAHIPPEVRYVLWEYRGVAVRSVAAYQAWRQSPGARERLTATRAFGFARQLERMANTGKVLYRDDRFVLFQIPPGGGS
jgi:hypothetical protein